MPMEVTFTGVRDAKTGEYLAGNPSDEMKSASGPVLARCADGVNWELVDVSTDPTLELTVKQDGGVRLVTVETPRRSTAKSDA